MRGDAGVESMDRLLRFSSFRGFFNWRMGISIGGGTSADWRAKSISRESKPGPWISISSRQGEFLTSWTSGSLSSANAE